MNVSGYLGWSAAALLFLPGSVFTILAQEPAPQECPATGIRQVESRTSATLTIPLPGHLMGMALPRTTDGKSSLYLLLTPVNPNAGKDPLLQVVAEGLASGELAAQIPESGIVRAASGDRSLNLSDALRAESDQLQALAAALKEAGIEVDVPAAANPLCPAAPGVDSTTLYRLDLKPEPALTKVLDHLPDKSSALLALDLDADGREELLLESEGTLTHLPQGPEAASSPWQVPLLHDSQLQMRAEMPDDVSFPPEPSAVRSPLQDAAPAAARRNWQGPVMVDTTSFSAPLHLRVTSLGQMRIYGPSSSHAPWELQSEIALPIRSTPAMSRLLLTTPQVRVAGRQSNGQLLLAAGPVPFGRQRLLTTLILLDDLQRPDVQSIWSRLPAGEEVHESGYLELHDEPYLWVETEQTESVEFFGGGNSLRFFRLSMDRSGAGVEPVLSFNDMKSSLETARRYGQDVNGDGIDDLLMVGRDDGIVLSAFIQDEKGGFSRTAARQALAGNGSPHAYGDDLDGDGLADLAVINKEEVIIFSGVISSVKGSQLSLLAPEPTWRARRLEGSANNADRVVCSGRSGVLQDLDGDQRREWLCVGEDGHRRQQLKILTFTQTVNPQPAP